MSFTNFLHPMWKRLTLSDNKDTHQAILSSLDKPISETEADVIESKVHSFLKTSEGKWLDFWGELFGVFRKPDESDSDYRQRILDYIIVLRGTLPAIKAAIRTFLDDYESYISIYEPFTNIFYLNSSLLNGEDRLPGEYYRAGVIDITVGTEIPAELVDVINDFKPAGITFYLTYNPILNGDREIVHLPPIEMTFFPTYTILTNVHGLNRTINGHMYLYDSKFTSASSDDVFVTNDSLLNSDSQLAGGGNLDAVSYNVIGSTTVDITPGTNNSSDYWRERLTTSDDNLYYLTRRENGEYGSVTIDPAEGSMYVYTVLDVYSYLELYYGKLIDDLSVSELKSYIQDTVIDTRFRGTLSPSTIVPVRIEGWNRVTNRWATFQSADQLTYEWMDWKIQVGALRDYLNDNLQAIIRYVIDVDPDGTMETYLDDDATVDTERYVNTNGTYDTNADSGYSYISEYYGLTVQESDTDNVLDNFSFHLDYFRLGFYKSLGNSTPFTYLEPEVERYNELQQVYNEFMLGRTSYRSQVIGEWLPHRPVRYLQVFTNGDSNGGSASWQRVRVLLDLGGRNYIVESTIEYDSYVKVSEDGTATELGGIYSSSSGNFVTDFIDVSDMSELTGSTSADDNNQRIAFYDENQEFIEGYETDQDVVTWTVPDNAVYAIYCGRDYETGSHKLESGNEATAWTPAPEDDPDYAYVTGNVSSPFDPSSGELNDVVTDTGDVVVLDESTYEGTPYLVIDLGQVYDNVDKIQVIHGVNDGSVYYEDVRIEVSSSSNDWYALYDSNIDGTYTETSEGNIVDNPLYFQVDENAGVPLSEIRADSSLLMESFYKYTIRELSRDDIYFSTYPNDYFNLTKQTLTQQYELDAGIYEIITTYTEEVAE